MKKSKTIPLLGILSLVVIVMQCPPAFANTTVSITSGSGSSATCSTHLTCYNPNTVTIQQGETVTWINQDSTDHMIISGNYDDKQTGTIFRSNLISSGDSFAFTFSQAGTYNYFDVLSYWMSGKIIVVASTTNGSITVSTNKSSYIYGDTIVISGYVNPVIPNQMIIYQLQLPTGDKSITSQVNPNPDGSFSISQRIANPSLSLGVYTVIVTYGGIQNQVTFSYVGSQSPAPTIPSTTSSIPSTDTPSIQYNIPYWVRNVAKWWGEGQISDDEFVKAIQYLTDNGILTPNHAMNEINHLQNQNQELKQQLQNLQNTNQQSQNQIKSNGNFKVIFQDSSNPVFQKIGQGLEQSGRGIDMENSLNSVFILPSDVTISFADCGQVNSMYNSDTKTITMCYDLIAYYIGLYNTLSPNDSTQASTYAVDATLFTFFHELGHALIDVYHLPSTGKEEDAVDQLSTLILLRTSDNQDDIKAVAAWFLIQGLQQNNNTVLPFWDEHSLNLQRFYDITCLAYGKDPVKYGYFITDKILPSERAIKCSSEYQKTYHSWSTLLKPYLKTSLTS